RFDSAMPTLKNRSGNFLAKYSVRVELFTSPSSTTMSAFVSPSWARARPNASRVALPSFITGPSYTDDFQSFLRFFRRQRQAVVVRIVDDVADRITLDRVGDDRAGLPFGRGGFAKRGQHFRQVVAIDVLREPAE